jgi:hypothetical protein
MGICGVKNSRVVMMCDIDLFQALQRRLRSPGGDELPAAGQRRAGAHCRTGSIWWRATAGGVYHSLPNSDEEGPDTSRKHPSAVQEPRIEHRDSPIDP